MLRVIAFTGPAGAGKSTAAQHLIDFYGFTRVRFAGPLKAAMKAMGLSDREVEGDLKQVPCALLGGKTPRFAMQTLGTEWGRELIHPGFWTGLWAAAAKDVLAAGGCVVVDDARFENEVDVIHALGGNVIRITGRGGIAGSHVSEAGCSCDQAILNSGALQTLRIQIDAILANAVLQRSGGVSPLSAKQRELLS